MKDIVFNAPVNALSFGNVSFNLLREMYRGGYKVSFFPIGEKIDLSSFDSIDKDFIDWIQSALDNRIKTARIDQKTYKLWHLNGSVGRITPWQSLLTFYELDEPTEEEIKTCNFQDEVLVTSEYTREALVSSGCDENKIRVVHLGVDEDFLQAKESVNDGRVNFSLMGKWEKRKHTAKIISLWVKKYGNNPKYVLNCLVSNDFIKQEYLQSLIREALGGEQYYNVNFLPRLKGNSQLSSFINMNDIDLTGLSGAEGWNLPSFNSAACGVWPVVLNATAHKEWATQDNSILVNPNGKTSSIDGIFFKGNSPYNQGNIFTWDEDEVCSAMDMAVNKVLGGELNENGIKLREKFTYKNTLSQIIGEK